MLSAAARKHGEWEASKASRLGFDALTSSAGFEQVVFFAFSAPRVTLNQSKGNGW
jgi:hypothetical protein